MIERRNDFIDWFTRLALRGEGGRGFRAGKMGAGQRDFRPPIKNSAERGEQMAFSGPAERRFSRGVVWPAGRRGEDDVNVLVVIKKTLARGEGARAPF